MITSGYSADPENAWQIGTPIVSYFAGPGFPGGSELNDASAQQLAEGGWNLVWCREKELDVLTRHGLRGQLTDPILNPDSLEKPESRAALDAFIGRVRRHAGLYAYYLTDEPGTSLFPAWGKLVAYLREHDPEHLAYINLLPVGATNEQLGTTGNMVDAYKAYLRQYVDLVRPALLSYDQYQFKNSCDTSGYIQNLALMRGKAMATGLPFINIVQACSWHPGQSAVPMASRVPTGNEMRYLAYTTLAYGAQGISYYVYSYPGHAGGIALADGSPTPLYHALKTINREFIAIAKELQPLKSAEVFHAGMQPPGATPVPADFRFKVDPPVPAIDYVEGGRVQGISFSTFGAAEGAPTHLLVVNLDYKIKQTIRLTGPSMLEVFDASTGEWSAKASSHVDLQLAEGEGKLVRIH
ncbi:MAG: hypothetical protein JWL90_2134 [Chthoniobacteraceae bacterium]|nr:hypothetical protein [Chthoniobacteraceae bacterium]